MARPDALLRLHKTLQGRLTDLRKKLADDIDGLRNQNETTSNGDVADAAFESGSDEMASQLAELDSREITQIERAVGPSAARHLRPLRELQRKDSRGPA